VRRFGRSVRHIERDGFSIAARVPMQRGDDSRLDQANGLSRGVSGLARYFEKGRPDIVVVLGDRIEAMAAALAAVATGRILAHIHGGDLAPGDIDESLRHAITKLAHVHFPATTAAARRIIRMGERPETVFEVGAPGLDELTALARSTRRTGRSTRSALVIQHPCGRSADVERRAAEFVLEAVRSAGLRRMIIYPNTDRGHSGIVRAIERHEAAYGGNGQVTIHRSLPRDEFVRALAEADLLVGNSSSGIIEAPVLGTPSVDVGDRQRGRERGGPSVVHAEESRQAVASAIRRALRRRRGTIGRSVYGDGRAGERIARILARIPLTATLRRKQLAYPSRRR
jgi:UDP-hydrolysing UDP-N-acetyl-D-glucosamine 2-epimerase